MSAATFDVAAERGREADRVLLLGPHLQAAVAWLVPFAAVLYLAMEGGGYGVVVRGQFGTVVWWTVLIGAVVGALPRSISRAGWAALALLGGFLVWSFISMAWTESDERTFVEVARISMVLGALALSVATVRRATSRYVLFGVATAIGAVALIAVLSRLQPSWFPDDARLNVRLSYPLNYWNGLAVFVAMGVPALLATASDARSLIGRSLAAAGLPVMALCVLLTVSRGGLGAIGAALLVFLALTNGRGVKLATLIAAAPGTAILIAATLRRDDVRDGLATAAAQREGDELMLALALVCAGTALAQLGVSLLHRHAERPGWMSVTRRQLNVMAVSVVLIGGAGAILAGAPGAIDRAWSEFKEPRAAAGVGGSTTFERLGSATGNGRYQYWQEAARAQSTRPFGGRGAGTFEYWWLREGGPVGGFVRDAHSLYLQTFAEVGIVGLVLMVGFLLLLLVAGVGRAIRGPAEDRPWVAAATAGVVAFAIGASVEWVWQIAVLPLTLAVFAGVLLSAPAGLSRPRWARPAMIAASLACIPLLVVSVSGATNVADSQAAAARGDAGAALRAARDAQTVQPYAATPRLQEALVLEQAGDLRGAGVAAKAATDREPTNWRTWLIRARIEAGLGNRAQALRLYRRARSLNPHSPIFTGRARS